MKSTSQKIQILACRKFALEQNERIVRQAHALNTQAHELLSHAHPNIDTFEQYHLLRHKAEEKFQEAAEHLSLVNENFAEEEDDNQSLRGVSLENLELRTLPKRELLA